MRTKLIVGAAIMAASLFTSLAQNVYSLNVVGYYNITVPGNGAYSLVANQLATANNTIKEVIPPNLDLANNAVSVLAYVKATGKLQENVTDGTDWFDNVTGDTTSTTTVLAPGGAFLISNPAASAFTQTFVGEVKQGTLTVPILPSLNAMASMTPQLIDLAAPAIGFPQSTEFTLLFLLPNGKYQPLVTDGSGTWFDNNTGDPVPVTRDVGQGFFVENTGASTLAWTRTFTVQ